MRATRAAALWLLNTFSDLGSRYGTTLAEDEALLADMLARTQDSESSSCARCDDFKENDVDARCTDTAVHSWEVCALRTQQERRLQAALTVRIGEKRLLQVASALVDQWVATAAEA